MAVKGSIAKSVVGKKIAEAFGADYIGESNNKIYVWATENGEKVQIAIALTCPKTPVGDIAPKQEDFNWDSGGDEAPKTASSYKPAEITDDERARVEALMRKLNL